MLCNKSIMHKNKNRKINIQNLIQYIKAVSAKIPQNVGRAFQISDVAQFYVGHNRLVYRHKLEHPSTAVGPFWQLPSGYRIRYRRNDWRATVWTVIILCK